MPVPLTRPEADRPMIFARQLRLATIQAVKRIQGIASFQSPGDWTTPPEKLPAILVRAPKDQKESKGPGIAQFTSKSTIEIEARLEASTEVEAQDQIEALEYQVEKVLLVEYSLIRIVEQVASIQVDREITADGKRHIAGFKMTVECQGYEVFDPTVAEAAADAWPLPQPAIVSLTGATLILDTASPADKTGTYADPPFPEAVNPAPRTEGPDGRVEGKIDVTLDGG